MSQVDTTLNQAATKTDLKELKNELQANLKEVIGDLKSGLEAKIENAVDTLARAVHTGFEETSRSFAVVNARLDRHSDQLHDLRQDIGRVDIRLSRLQDTNDENKLDIATLDGRVVNVEQKVELEPKPLRP